MSAGNAETGEPNLTPILDMVFQLITFFMLVINFKAASLDLSLNLPVVGSARPLDGKGEQSTLVLNIDAQGRLLIFGAEKDISTFIAQEARFARVTLQSQGVAIDGVGELPTTVVVRADRSTPFKLLNRVIAECQQHGFRKFSLKVVNRDGGESP